MLLDSVKMYWKIPSNYGTLLTGKHQEVCHEAKNRRSLVPEDIRAKINGLQSLLDHAADLYSDIYSWYDSELKSYDPKATADDELFDPGTGTVVRGSITCLSWNPCQSCRQPTNVKCRGINLVSHRPGLWRCLPVSGP